MHGILKWLKKYNLIVFQNVLSLKKEKKIENDSSNMFVRAFLGTFLKYSWKQVEMFSAH